MVKKIFKHYFFLIVCINSSFLCAGDPELLLREEDMFIFSENQTLLAAQKHYIPLIEKGEFFVSLEAHAALVAVYRKEHEASRKLSIEFKKKKSLWETIFSSVRFKQDKNLII